MNGPNLIFFQQPERAPDIFGVIGRGDDMEKFYNAFRIKRVMGNPESIIGRKNGSPGCFSIIPNGDGWDISWYANATPLEIYNHIMVGVSDECETFKNTPTFKYLGMDIIKILRDNNIPI